MDDKGQTNKSSQLSKEHNFDDFVLEKSIFSNVFDKDIRRVYIYKKAERLARALHLVSPAFAHSTALKRRADEIAIALVDGAVLPPLVARAALSRELLALSSLLSIVRTTGVLSSMNADLIGREAHMLLEEIASYEEPRLLLEHAPTLAELAKEAPKKTQTERQAMPKIARPEGTNSIGQSKGHLSDTPQRGSRRETILGLLRSKGPSYIKDISTVMLDVSEKTIQRELQALVGTGAVKKEGERRWTRYSLPS
jgi:DNA-binding transcriptional ArsR family regulator